jgi:hypothetical protein
MDFSVSFCVRWQQVTDVDDSSGLRLAGVPAVGLYGAISARTSEVELETLFHATAGRLRSDILLEFLAITRSAPILSRLLRPAQDLLVRAAVDLTPGWVQTILALNRPGLHAWEAKVVRRGFRGPPHSGIQPRRSVLSAHAPSGRLFLCSP